MSPTQSIAPPAERSRHVPDPAPTLDAEEHAGEDPTRAPAGGTGEEGAAEDAATDESREQTLLRSALAVLIERAGGEIEYTEAEFRAILASHGPHRLVGVVDSTGPGAPVIRMRIELSQR